MASERLHRHDDEQPQQLRSYSRRIRELDRISQQSGEPIDVPVDQALQEFVKRQSRGEDQSRSKVSGDSPSTLSDCVSNRSET